MHQRLPDWGGNFWTASGVAAGGQAPHQEQSRPLFPESRVRGDGQRRHAGSVSVARAIRETRPARARTGVSARPNASLAKTFLSVLRVASAAVRGPGSGNSQEPEGT